MIMSEQTSAYKQFFAQYPIVISVHHVINLLPSLLTDTSNPTLTYPINTKLYLWWRPSDHMSCDPLIYRGLDQTRQHTSMRNPSKQAKLWSVVWQYLASYEHDQCYRFALLSEQALDIGFGGVSLVCGLCSLACHMMTGQISDLVLSTAQYDSVLALARQFKQSITGKSTQRSAFIQSSLQFGWLPCVVSAEQTQPIGISQDLPYDVVVIHTDISHEPSNIKSALYQEIASSKPYHQHESIQQSWHDIVSNKIDQTIKEFELLVHQPHNPTTFYSFISRLHQWNSLVEYFQWYNNLMNDIRYELDQHKIYPQEFFAVVPFGSAYTGGSIQIVSMKGVSRETITKALTKIQSRYQTLHISRDNRIQMWSHGPHIEQYLQQGIYSDYIPKDTVVLRSLSGDVLTYAYDKIFDDYPDYLIIDTIHQRFWFNGAEFTHPLIKSVSFSLQLLAQLFTHLNTRIKNKHLPYSGYSKAKNQMVGKIVGPLLTVIKELFGETMSIICEGWLHEYSIMLKSADIPILIILPLQSP